MTSLMRYQFRNLLSYCLFPGILPSPTMDRGRVIRLVLHSTAVTTFSLIASTTEPTPNGVYGTKFAMKGEFLTAIGVLAVFPKLLRFLNNSGVTTSILVFLSVHILSSSGCFLGFFINWSSECCPLKPVNAHLASEWGDH